jgi:hypothetical protein
MFFDVVHRQGLDLTEWLGVVTAEYDQLLRDAGVAPPTAAVFRPGGWDHGSTTDEMQNYVRALAHCGYAIDSSDATGSFGDPSWRVGLPFGRNAYRLSGGLFEIAPSWAFTCGAPLASRRGLAPVAGLARQPRLWMTRQPGVSVCVLHFDHVFHDWGTRDEVFGVLSPVVVADRIHRMMRTLSIVQTRLGLAPSTFDDLTLPAEAPRAEPSHTLT